MKSTLIIIGFLFGAIGFSQNNILDTSSWTVGMGSVTGFPRYGSDIENVRELDSDPFGGTSVIWKGSGDDGGSSGGWQSSTFSVDHTKTYRFSVWMKKTGSFAGNEVFAMEAFDSNGNDTGKELDGDLSANPIFWASDMPALDTWYLYIGFVHHSGYTGTSNMGGIYDPSTGNKVTDILDFKFSSTSVEAKHRAYYWQGTNLSDVLSLYGPTVYEVNGLEPSIQDLLNGPGNADTLAPSPPSLASSGQGESSVDLTWNGATDDTGVTNYRIYKDATLETTVGNINSYQVTGLTSSTTYDFAIRALDAAGNESSSSNIVTVTTDSGSGGGSTGSVWSESGSVASYSGNVAIGTPTVPTGYKLAVDGHIRTREIRVDQDTWPDYVFTDEYLLPTLEEIKKHIDEKGHLPKVPSAEHVKANGIEVGDMNRLLLEKIEELTLHTIYQENLLNKQKEINQDLLERIEKLEVFNKNQNLPK